MYPEALCGRLWCLTAWPMSTRLVAVYQCDVARACRDVLQEAGIVPIPRLCTAVAEQQQESDPAERMAAEGRATNDERCSMPYRTRPRLCGYGSASLAVSCPPASVTD